MSDGAHLGLSAEQSMKAALGGDIEEPPLDPESFAWAIRQSTQESCTTYSGTANYCARLILEWLEEDPSRAETAPENEYARGEDGRLIEPMTVIYRGWYDTMKETSPETYARIYQLDLTGFMWGWAVNAARKILELPEVPNPAIVTIGGSR